MPKERDDARIDPDRPPLVPRFNQQGYDRESVNRRRAWVEEQTESHLGLVGYGSGRGSLDPETFRGNVENVIGTVQTPLGVAGPLRVRGEHADGVFYVPLATTEGALVRSYERGMVALTRAGGAEARIWLDRNRITPVFSLPDVGVARSFALRVEAGFERWREVAAGTTRHGRLEEITCLPVGREVYVDLEFHTADAHGMNMLSKAADAICKALSAELHAPRWQILSGYSAEKRPAGSLLRGGKGKKVTAGCTIPARTVRAVLRSTPEDLAAMWHRTVLGHLASGALGHNGHVANGLTALFLATGQDVANVANSSVAITQFEVVDDEDQPGRSALWASVTLPSLTVATVGGGTGLGTSRECLDMLDCVGSGRARKLAEIACATLLAGELSMAAAIASGEFVEAHETYGRNRPDESSTGPDT